MLSTLTAALLLGAALHAPADTVATDDRGEVLAGWRIVSIADTYETSGCPPRSPPAGNPD